MTHKPKMGRLLALAAGVMLSSTLISAAGAQTAVPQVRDPEATGISTVVPVIEGGVTLDAQPAVVVQPVIGQVNPAFAAILPTPEQIAASQKCVEDQLARRAAYVVPQSPVFRPFDRVPPPTMPGGLAGGLQTDAPNDFVTYRNVTLNNTAHNNATSTTNEPSLGGNGKVMFYSGNWYTAFSVDYGQTWSYRNPYTSYGANPASGGFCCDQVVYYDWTRNIMVLYQQYLGNQNPGRIIVYRSQQDIVNNSWIVYDILPSTLGLTAAGANFDFPDMAASFNRLYITTNVGGSAGTAAVVIRLNLDQLAAGATATVEHFRSPLANLRCTQEAGSTMYVGTQVNTSTLRVFSWPEANAAPTSVDRTVSTYFNTTSSSPSPDGTNWVGRDFHDILAAAYTSNNAGQMVFMWGSAQGGGFAWPNVRFAVFDTALNVVTQSTIWNPQFGIAYPTATTNSRGHWGGLIAFGGGNTAAAGNSILYPSLYAWLADDVNAQVLAPLENLPLISGTSGPSNNRWGDYYTARRHSPYQTTFLGSGHVLQGGGGGANVRAQFSWFGRDRDRPPATNTIYVDQANLGLRQEGTQAFPYRTVGNGLFASVNNDTIRIRAGTYLETPFVTGKNLFFRGWAPGVTGNSLIGGN